MAKKVTIRDVAAKAGVSYQTVSRVINNKADVAPETRERVRSVIETLNYRPSIVARTLAQNQSRIIGFVMPFDAGYLSEDPHLLQVICGAVRQAALHDYSTLLVVPASQHEKMAAYERLLKDYLIDGVIVEGKDEEEGITRLLDSGYPVVVVGYKSNGMYGVHSDDEGGAYSLAQHLIALGHQKIALIHGPEGDLAMAARWKGYQQAFRDAGIEPDPDLFERGDYSSSSGYEATNRLMEKVPRPTVILAFNDRMAIGAIRWLHNHGYKVPNDISVVGFDDIPCAQDISPALTTVRQYSYALGQRAADVLIDLIAGKQPQVPEIVLATQPIIRSSTAALKR
jgi:DNA-binding LacI/PurR family transcriptional regulator